ncbi:MAG: 30S ribosomal protein S7 [Candidatus Marinimicrobia bacterium]|jgi:small subunit ribosomal protein S7|nr:30S ribosomal protein S7 [Candidatus Neomarinimicrobiota bacterium]MBT3676610.1 30S ribosomal protein S7 [Candidatus Neomarinimicrobiota bacterium]MBT3763990.1 30S ribosomal protein S7 [Candidatus Neomarinimicrobiota bacterium]MBT4068454.1 30S ribosomal protein S7 [Candidatus Neomarinimicrobiota bacterium]MBT4307542.1 30S ribosomal protein S7 [Candidatus Neomarinimicrobiota bacterium]
MRRRRPEKRKILPDPIYNDLEVAKFMNYLMFGGKKGAAEQIFYGAMGTIKSRTKKDGVEIFKLAVTNTAPMLEVKSRRVGGATYQVPIEVPKHRQFFLASHWLINAARSRSGKPMQERLAAELISAANNEGGAIKKKEDTHRMAEANRAFAHFR